MQTLTFTQKLLRQRRLFGFLLPLFAIFVGAGATQKAFAQAYTFSNVTITARTTSAASSNTSTLYVKRSVAGQPTFDGAALGGTSGGTPVKFDPANGGVLTLDASAIQVSGAPGATAATLFYRVYLMGTSAGNIPSYSVATLADKGNGIDFDNNAININILNQPSVLGGGDYNLEIYFTYTYNDPIDGPTQVRSPAGTAVAKFSLVAPAVTPPNGSTTWISDGVSPKNSDWLDPINWSNGVPTRFSDAIIPEKPNNTTTAPPTVTPVIADPTQLYEVRTLTLNGASNSQRALLRIGNSTNNTPGAPTGSAPVGGTLHVYGDLNVYGGGILGATSGTNGTANPVTNSTIVLNGATQTVRGILNIVDFRVEGTGFKNIVNEVRATNTFTFAPGVTAIVRTVLENASTTPSTFSLNTTLTSSVNLKSTGVLYGETNDAYIQGVTLADRSIFAGVTQTFGNIGIDITSNRDIPGPTIQITRTIGDPLNGPIGRSARPIKRQYGVSGDVNVAPTVSTVVFHYLNSADELNGIDETNLTMFRTVNNGIPYFPEGGVQNIGAKTVTRTNMTAINTLTLGDKTNPLPVNLTSFDAKRAGADVAVTWSTASEKNSKGYNVQVSTNGTDFRTLGFVSSASANSSTAQTYSYMDTEKNKTTLRYYRLQQIDLDGKDSFYGPRTVSFEGEIATSATEGTSLLAYPNPFNSADQLHLTLQSTSAGQSSVTVTDLTGRTVRQQTLDLGKGNNDVTVEGLNDLKAGVYMVRLTQANGQVKSLKVVKQ
ncbi:T9SS type A sorting domain-containing protein [Hymenobacter sp. 5317J-9]|uniref:T9SS type A sorting domain-containing protein n=1 Tax=Hymenobacter sp. 5317J-9 TaxID=2932250 RepID=UPI001FD6DBF5|nr:T9SS type A sorting domain-containing protein [Hymenobacter sp. 5317J-9]UOQ98386.1 T9SS type A sorting domain-containing protein [Hymenobacter sp. 5317J-9]